MRSPLTYPLRFGRAYAERLPRAELLELERGGPGPWLEHPELVERVCDFLRGNPDSTSRG